MVDKIEMSLDDIIKSTRSQKKPQAARGGPGGARKTGGQQRFAGGARRGGANAGGSPRKPGSVLKGPRGGVAAGAVQKAKFPRVIHCVSMAKRSSRSRPSPCSVHQDRALPKQVSCGP